jgi:exopolyphosphatase/guanosine-5'-triphosphate,3'-diphosphate pyrophosphatase
MKVESCYPIATAAVRRAKNGSEFRDPAENILGMPVQILSKADEANHVSRGLTLNLPEATGLVADLGGGSIEIIALRRGEVCHSVSLNYGHLSSVTASEIGSALAEHSWIRDFGAKQLFGVGGSFRTIGSAFISRTGYPLHVLHGLKIKRKDVLAICRDLRSDEPSLEGVPLSRAATIPVAAMIIQELIEFSKVYRLTVSGTSVRDGVIAINELNANQQADFLMAVSEEIAESTGRVANVSPALKKFLKPLSKICLAGSERLINVAANMSDLCWHEHSDLRGDIAARHVLSLPVNCVTHKERVWLAVALYHRHFGLKPNKARPQDLDVLLSKKRISDAMIIGLAMRFALDLSAGTGVPLRLIKLFFEGNRLVLSVDPSIKNFIDRRCRQKFDQLAAELGYIGELVFTNTRLD